MNDKITGEIACGGIVLCSINNQTVDTVVNEQHSRPECISHSSPDIVCYLSL